jgi:hypothetical protein
LAEKKPRKPTSHKKETQTPANIPAIEAGSLVWLRAEYITHVFHYRMPGTVAIASVNPLIPSPLTIKMAMLATLLRDNRVDEARQLVNDLPHIRVLIQPPVGVMTFKAFMRYVRVPATKKAGEVDSMTGGVYGVSPHVREYALWDGPLTVFVETPEILRDVIESALFRIAYLGAKDSQVACLEVSESAPDEQLCAQPAQGITSFERGGLVVRLAEWVNAPDNLEQVIPSQRREADYKTEPYVMPGRLHTAGKSKIYQRDANNKYSFAFLDRG